MLTRREFLAGAAATSSALAAGLGRAAAAQAAFDGTIRVATLPYDLLEPIRKRAEKDLRLSIVCACDTQATIERWGRQQPGSYDVFSSVNSNMGSLWPDGAFQPVEIARVRRWREITPLLRLGKVRPGDPHCTYGEGDAAFRRLYVDPDRSGRWRSAPGTPPELDGLIVEWIDEATGKPVGPEPRYCTGVPHVFNFDSLGYNARVIRKRPEQVSWAELLNRRWRGRAALYDDADIGFADASCAARAAGLVRIADFGNPTRKEIDALVKVLFVLKRQRQFFTVWDSTSAAVEMVHEGDIVISTMFAFQISSLAARGLDVRQAAPPEGYRAFCGLLSISSEVADQAKLEACYDFINWWHSGFAGAFLMRQGFFNAVQETSRRFAAPGEYAYWIEGKPADRNYAGVFGGTSVRKGQVRDGGSFARRACRIWVWRSRPKEREYRDQRWREFVSSFRHP
jgi:putative spermidine/putrescine transport system substrate-binding protein